MPRPRAAGDTRPRARVIGDPKGTVIVLPAGRGSGRRTLLAKTCLGCGELKNAAAFPLSGTARTPDPRCDACHAARWSTLGTPRRGVQQSDSRRTATHHGEEWTDAQLRIALREDLSMDEAARLAGRTWMAVRNIRRKSGLTKA